MQKVLITEPIHEEGLRILEGKAEIIGPGDFNREELRKLAPEISGIIVRAYKLPIDIYYRGNKLKIISKHGTGVDNINIPLATEKGIVVTNTPAANSNSVAEYAVAIMMNISRQVCTAASLLYSTAEGKSRHSIIGNELAGKTLGICGLGNIGSRIARKCREGLEMNIIGFDPFLARESAARIGLKLTRDKEELFKKADYISLNLSLNEHTKEFVTIKELRLMKRSAFLINTSRGGIINESDLAKALNKGIIAGAALDVLSKEPADPDNPLLTAKNLLLTPHIAAQTEEAMIAMAVGAVYNLLDILNGKESESILNREVLASK